MKFPAISAIPLGTGFLLVAGLCAGTAAADTLSCPPNIEFVPSVEVVDAPAGWQPRAWPEIHFLSGARLYDGDPAELVQLQEERGEGRGYDWPLEPPSEGRPYMLVCTYEGTEMTFVAAVPAGATKCSVRVVPDDSRGVRYGEYVTDKEQTEVVCE